MADNIWTADCVADHFEEAFRTLRKLPPVKAQGFINAWPQIVRTEKEILAMEPEPMRGWPSTAAITRLEQTFDWVLWLGEDERRLIWWRAARRPWKEPAQTDARVTFAAFQMAYRLDPMTAMIAAAVGLSQQEIDAIWTGFGSV